MQEFLDVEVAGTHSYHSALRGVKYILGFPKTCERCHTKLLMPAV